jgi:hypothetical protein
MTVTPSRHPRVHTVLATHNRAEGSLVDEGPPPAEQDT